MNFCTKEIGTKICCAQAESDGFEAVNLFQQSEDANRIFTFGSLENCGQRKGFMAEYFVKPPVTIKLTFPVPVNISHIVLSPRVGNQQSSAFLFEAAVLQKQNSRRQVNHTEKMRTTLQVIGKEYINSDREYPSELTFRNPRFLLRTEFHSLPLTKFELHRNSPNAFGLKHPTWNACEEVVSLDITILRVSASGAPAIGFLEVWGQPSAFCTNLEVETLMSKLGFRTQVGKTNIYSPSPRPRLPGIEDLETADSTEPPNKNRKLCDLFEMKTTIPEEFIDPLTCEVMCQPFRLPSGIAVDFVTLEKFNTEEAHWGRPAKDPFTGKCFTDLVKPVPDAALKSRIDAFLTKHSDVSEFQTIPRTLGSTNRASDLPNNPRLVQNPRILSVSDGNNPPTQIVEQLHDTTSIALLTNSVEKNRTSQEIAKILVGGSSYLIKAGNSGGNSHAIKPNDKHLKCDFCHAFQTDSGDSILAFYRTSCGHVHVCRNCVTSSKPNEASNFTKVCVKCGLKLQPTDLTRVHKL